MIIPKLPIPTPRIPLDVLIKIGKSIWKILTGKDEKQKKLSEKKGLNPEKSEAIEIAELNQLLQEYRGNIIAASDQLEREMIAECTVELQEIMNVFNSFNQELKVARSESIKKKFRRLNDELKGTFADYISKHLSLDDVQCVRVLRLPAGDLKNQRLQELKQNVFAEATDAIIKKIQYSVEDFSETVEDAFLEYLERAESSVEEKRSALEKLSKTTEADTASAESILLKAHYVLAMCFYADEL